MSERVFLDTSVLLRYLGEDDPPRAFAAAGLIDSDRTLVLSGVVIMEAIHSLRTTFGMSNPDVARVLAAFLSKANVELVDADKAHVVGALQWSVRWSARRIADSMIASTAAQAKCDWIATFDEGFSSPSVPSRLI
jgi:predicted nucleic acid-binding protein